MRSRRNIQLKVRVTEVVPAPEDPVTAMIGCFVDMRVLLPNSYQLRNNERSLNSGEL